jgi:hypothetical protein
MIKFVIVLLIFCFASDYSFGAEEKGVASVAWGNITIVDGARIMPGGNWSDLSLVSPKPKIVDCTLDTISTKCWKYRVSPKKNDSGPGADLQYVKPFPVVPFLSREFKHKYDPDAVSMKRALSHWIWIGSDTDQTGYVPVENAFKGAEVIALWKALINITPAKVCDCSVVLAGKVKGEDAIAYCHFDSDKNGDGLPSECWIIAYMKKGIWNVYSYTGAEQCSGCGAADDDSCTIFTDATPDKVADVMKAALRNGITHIDLKQVANKTNKEESEITLQGKNEIVDSKWERGHFEKARARYVISRHAGENFVIVSGLYYLLVSVEPIEASQNWHDVQDLKFFHERILNIIKGEVGSKLSKSVSCQANGSGWAD